MVDPQVIDGSIHPEQVPDHSAYRLFLLAVSKPHDATPDQLRHQEAQLRPMGLSDRDHAAVITLLATFNSRYTELIRSYNEVATRAQLRGQRTDITPMLRERDLLVRTTHDTLKSLLTADGWNRFDRYVQFEKTHMRVAAKEAAQ
jgi:hypothetical protein